MLNSVTPVQQILARHRGYLTRLAAARERFDLAKGLIGETNLDAAITAAARDVAVNLNLDLCLPALAKAVLLDSLRDRLVAALKTELIDVLENDCAAFETENSVILRAHDPIKT